MKRDTPPSEPASDDESDPLTDSDQRAQDPDTERYVRSCATTIRSVSEAALALARLIRFIVGIVLLLKVQ
jgi:hypothetical protein